MVRLGTRSVLFGAHAFWHHPFFVALGWWRLYGFPRDPRLWFAFILHDVGYIGKRTIDGEDGKLHPELGGRIMGRLFGPDWRDFTLLHSRSMAARHGAEPSKLCWADKMGAALTPGFLYVPLVLLTGEWREYRKTAVREGFDWPDEPMKWYRAFRAHNRRVATRGAGLAGL